MPANLKYLSVSGWERFGRFTAGFIGGYLLTIAFHLALGAWLNTVNVVISSTYTGFILWTVLFILAYISKKVWKVWLLYLGLSLLFFALFYLGKLF